MESSGNNSSIIFFIAITLFVSALFFVLLLNTQKKSDKSEDVSGTLLSEEADQNDSSTAPKLESAGDVDELLIETVREGEGAEAKNGDELVVNYEGRFLDGTVFDSSYERGDPFNVVLGSGSVIPGWEQGLLGMKVGEERTLTIPSSLAYGPNDYMGIPGGSALVFKVELLEIL